MDLCKKIAYNIVNSTIYPTSERLEVTEMPDTSDGYTCGGPDPGGGSYQSSGEGLMDYWYDRGSGGSSSSARGSGGSSPDRASSTRGKDDSGQSGKSSLIDAIYGVSIILVFCLSCLTVPAFIIASIWKGVCSPRSGFLVARFWDCLPWRNCHYCNLLDCL